MIDINEYGNITKNCNRQEKYRYNKVTKKIGKKLQKIITKVGATNEQTNENKVQDKNKTKFLY